MAHHEESFSFGTVGGDGGKTISENNSDDCFVSYGLSLTAIAGSYTLWYITFWEEILSYGGSTHGMEGELLNKNTNKN